MSKNRHNRGIAQRDTVEKNPRAQTTPQEKKIPRAEVIPSEHSRPEFKTERMDFDGPWSWGNLKTCDLQEFLTKIFESQKLTWQALRDNGSHLVDIDGLVSNGRKRLREIGQDDLDQLYSLRITGQRRVWCIKESNLLWLLWWDPLHSVCPCAKKNT